MIQLDHVGKRFPADAVALQDVTLRIEKGEFVWVHGPSGAGKSTLLKLLYREILPTEGIVLVNGRNVVSLRSREVPHFRRSIGVVFQNFRLIPDRTVEENVDLALRVVGASPLERSLRTNELFRVVGLEHKRHRYPHELSAGEQQRTSIARALAVRPVLLLADEPTGNLDKGLAFEILDLFRDVHTIGCTVVVATHSEALLERFPRRSVRIEQGRVVEDRGRPA